MSFMDTINEVICGGADILRLIKFVWILLDLVFWIVPMGLIVIISVDFLKNVMAGKEDNMKKNLNLVIKRIIFCVALFFVKPIVEFGIGILGDDAKIENWTKGGEEIGWAECVEIATSSGTDFNDYEIDWKFDDYSNTDSSTDTDGSSSGAGAIGGAAGGVAGALDDGSVKIDVSGYTFKSEKIKKLVSEGKAIELGAAEQFWINGVRNVNLKKIIYNKETGNYKDAYALQASNSKEYTISELSKFEIKKITEITESNDVDVDSIKFKDATIKELVKNKKPIEIKAGEQLLINGSVVILVGNKLTYDSETGVYVNGLIRYTITELATAEIKKVNLTDSLLN